MLTFTQIGKTSGLVVNLTGIFKSILLVLAGVVAWGTPISLLQLLGYTLALVGMLFYSTPLETLQELFAQMRKDLVSMSPS